MRRVLFALLLCACGGDGPERIPLGPTLESLDANVFWPKCTAPCHSGGELAAGGLDMSGDLLAALVDEPPTSDPCTGEPWLRLVPGDPGASLLYEKVSAKADGTDPQCGEGMPSGNGRPELSVEEIAAMRQWIAAGAPGETP